MATLCREAAIPASVLAWIVAFGSAGIENTGAASAVQRPAPALAAVASLADNLPPVALATANAVAPASSMTSSTTDSTASPATEAATVEATLASKEAEPIVTAALPDSSEALQSATPPQQANTTTAMLEPGDLSQSVEAQDECVVVDACVDHYLWALYQRTPKEDSVKIQEKKNVTVKKKGKLVNVIRTLSHVADEDFGWKDPKAAETAGMSLTDYVIGGMDREFKLKLFRMLHAAEAAGLSPGITSAFRDDYRQSIASGLKAADNRSYHGGSLRGGYGHGLAADVVSVNGATRQQRLNSSETFWKWIDAHGTEFGIARPYLGKDPPHVAPVDGKEYADHQPGRFRKLLAKLRDKLTLHDDRSPAKPARIAKPAKPRAIRPT